MLKRVVPPPQWLATPLEKAGVTIDLVYSAVDCCTSTDFAEWISAWKHNGWWFFDDPAVLDALAVERGCDPAALTLFYYEAFEQEFVEEPGTWRPIVPEPSFATNVLVPARKTLQGYDVVTYYAGTSPECSPLSCNSLAAQVPVNRFCLFDTFEAAHAFAQSALCASSEPGPYRVIAVHTPQGDW